MVEIQVQVTNDFQEILNDIGESVSLYRATKTVSNMEGAQNLTYGSSEKVKVVFQYNTSDNIKDREGQMDLGETVVYAFSSLSLSIGDKIVRNYDNTTWRIEDTHPRYGVDMCNLTRYSA